MAKIDILTLTGLTAGDGSIIASGATIKFDSDFTSSTTDIKITPKVYRNREVFEMGYWSTPVMEDVIPYDFMLSIPEEEYYVLTPMKLYDEVCEYLNNWFGADVFIVEIIE